MLIFNFPKYRKGNIKGKSVLLVRPIVLSDSLINLTKVNCEEDIVFYLYRFEDRFI